MLGGIKGAWRELISEGPHAQFEQDVNNLIGDRIRNSDNDACAFWCSLANNKWTHPIHGDISYSFRAAGDLIAALREQGDYMDWYCCSFEYAVVAEWIQEALATAQWTPEYINGDENPNNYN